MATGSPRSSIPSSDTAPSRCNLPWRRGQGDAARPLRASAANSGRWDTDPAKQSLLLVLPGPALPRQQCWQCVQGCARDTAAPPSPARCPSDPGSSGCAPHRDPIPLPPGPSCRHNTGMGWKQQEPGEGREEAWATGSHGDQEHPSLLAGSHRGGPAPGAEGGAMDAAHGVHQHKHPLAFGLLVGQAGRQQPGHYGFGVPAPHGTTTAQPAPLEHTPRTASATTSHPLLCNTPAP